MGYSSASDGEIMDIEGEKATRTRPLRKDPAIDRKSRPRSPLSRSPRPLNRPFQLDASHDGLYDGPSDTHHASDSRHRPSRAGGLDYGDDYRQQYQTGHGQKRRHDHDPAAARNPSDQRRFQVRYEPDHHQSHDRRDPHRSERDRDRDSNHRSTARHSAYGDHPPPGKRHQSDQHRARSRSPRSRGYRDRQPEPTTHLARDAQRRRRSSTNSTADQEGTSVSLNSKSQRAEQPSSSHQQNPSTDLHPNLDEAEPVIVDEAKLIEERRKRREALRAKHRGQDIPLLQKALETSATSQPASTQADDSEVTSTIASPSLSQPASPASLASPAVFSVTNDEELANPAQASPNSQLGDDGPSAADYDPNMDMQDSKLRVDRFSAANEHNDLASQSQDIHGTDQLPKATQAKEFDMFADDDEDDMFAPEPTTGHKKDDGTQAVRIPEAKQLDRGLLDDWDDPEGYYRIILGELLDDRYHVQTNLGKGVFSAVVRALDTKTDRLVAIKVIRKQESMYKAGMKEIEILQTIADADPEDKKHMIRLERQFEHKGHLCMVFENLSINLREVLKKFGRDIGINIKAVRSYAQQMFLGLSLLRKCEILHADLKPDNVLVNETRSQLKIADLGSAMSARDNEITDMLVSRFYRAPEIMLGIRHDYAIDMWSIGCTLFELYTGKICFTGPTNNQMLKAIMECRGKVPNRMLKKSEFWAQHFDPDGTFLSQEIDAVARKEFVRRTIITRPDASKELRARLFSNAKGLSPADAKELNAFADLLDKCLALDPARRITPNEALKHGFITRVGLSK